MDKCTQQHEVLSQQTYRSRFRSDRRKEDVLTRGDPGIDSVSMSQEVSKGHSNRSNEPEPLSNLEVSQPGEYGTLNVSNEFRSHLVACLQTRNKDK